MPDDILAVFLRRALDHGLSQRDADVLERELRVEFGGARMYVLKAPAALKTRTLAESLAAGVPINEAFYRAGVSRATGYRLICRRCR